jgi:hypothetical protein
MEERVGVLKFCFELAKPAAFLVAYYEALSWMKPSFLYNVLILIERLLVPIAVRRFCQVVSEATVRLCFMSSYYYYTCIYICMYMCIYIYNLSDVAARVAAEASDAPSPQVLLYRPPRTIQCPRTTPSLPPSVLPSFLSLSLSLSLRTHAHTHTHPSAVHTRNHIRYQ